MNKPLIKNKTVVLIILFILSILMGCNSAPSEVADPVEIIKIEDESFNYEYGLDSITVDRHFMILNVNEEDHEKLRKLIEDFLKDNNSYFEEKSYALDEKTMLRYNQEDINFDYRAWFYRESKDLLRDWEPSSGLFSIDTLRNHKDDFIVIASWDESVDNIRYQIMQKSTRRRNYGQTLKEYYYTNDILTKIIINDITDYTKSEFVYPDDDEDGISNKDELELGTDPENVAK